MLFNQSNHPRVNRRACVYYLIRINTHSIYIKLNASTLFVEFLVLVRRDIYSDYSFML